MFLNKELKKVQTIARKGELNTLKLPSKMYGSYDVLINLKNKELSFTEGDSIFIIDEKIGILEESEFTIFLADKYIVTELQWGRIYLKDENNKTYYVTETGSVIKKNIDDEHIKWLTQADLLVYLELMVAAKYNIPKNNKELVRSYINNLSITLISANEKIKVIEKVDVAINTYMFRLKAKEYYNDLGLDNFDYKTFEVEPKPSFKLDKVVDLAYLDEEKRLAKSEKRKEKRAEMDYMRIKDGEDFIETDYSEEKYSDDEDEIDTEELYTEELYIINGYSITDIE